MTNKDKKNIEQIDSAIEVGANNFAAKVSRTVNNWLKNDTFFDGFRNTYARVLITAISYVILYGWGAIAFYKESSIVGYSFALACALLMQAISVRFVFNSGLDLLLDEYQAQRRDVAYRKAYRGIRGVITLLLLVWVGATALDSASVSGLVQNLASVQRPASLDNYRLAVLGVFLLGEISLQKYIAYGFKGEPFVSRLEAERIKNS